jgi:CRISPR-associated Csh1 family protein
MIQNLYRLGKALENQEGFSDYFSPWQNPFPRGDKDKANVIYFNIQDGQLVGSYEIEPFKPLLLNNYLYRKPPGANGAPLVPTSPFYPDKNAEKHKDNLRKLMDRIRRSIPDEGGVFFRNKEQKDAALQEAESQLESFSGNPENRYLLTFKVDGKWLGEFEENKKLFYDEAYSKYFDKSSAKEKLCAVTYKQVPEVWGRIDTLGFTLDTLTFSRNGFSGPDSYKMFPVSPEAVRLLEGAKEFAKAKLARSFESLRYFIVPHFIEGREDLMWRAVDTIILKNNGTESLEDLSKSIFSNEKVIYNITEDKLLSKEGVFYDILFYQQNQAQFAIKLHLADILPSRFATIFSVKSLIEHRYRRLNRIDSKKGVTEYFVTFSKIRNFFSMLVKKEVVFHPFFYKILEAVFYGQPLDEQSVVSAFMSKIQEDFKQRHESETRFIFTTKEAFALWHFFLGLNLFPYQNIEDMEEKPVARDLDGFIREHPAFFSSPYKKAAFFTGCLTQILVEAQYKKLNSQPFLEKLNGLSLDDKDLRVLFPKILEKINQYGEILFKYESTRNYIQRLEAAIVPVLIEETDLSRTEISFAFVSGLVMQREFTQYEIKQRKEAKEIAQ